MGRKPVIDKDDVARAATRLISQGERPTVDAVHEGVGKRGSRTTVHNLLKAFLKEFGEKGMNALPSSIPEPLIPIVEDFWAQALVQAGSRYDADRETYTQEIESLKQELDKRDAVIREREEEIKKRDDLLLDRERFIDQQHRTIEVQSREMDQLKQVVAGHERVIENLKDDKARLWTQIQEERKTAQARFDGAEENWARQQVQLEQAANDAKVQLAEGQEKMNTLTDYWIMQVDDARQQMRELKERHEEDKKRWEGDLLLQSRRADRYALTLSEFEQTNEAMKVCVEKQEKTIANYYELLVFCVEQAGGAYLEKELPF